MELPPTDPSGKPEKPSFSPGHAPSSPLDKGGLQGGYAVPRVRIVFSVVDARRDQRVTVLVRIALACKRFRESQAVRARAVSSKLCPIDQPKNCYCIDPYHSLRLNEL